MPKCSWADFSCKTRIAFEHKNVIYFRFSFVFHMKIWHFSIISTKRRRMHWMHSLFVFWIWCILKFNFLRGRINKILQNLIMKFFGNCYSLTGFYWCQNYFPDMKKKKIKSSWLKYLWYTSIQIILIYNVQNKIHILHDSLTLDQ